jgi:chitinase
MPKKAIIVPLLALGLCVFIFGCGGSSTRKASSPAGAPPRYAPYADATLPMPQFPSRKIVLSFIIGNRCTPTWGGLYTLAQATTINTRIQQAQAIGDQVIVSFGGETGPELATSCTNSTQLEGAYQAVVARYGLRTIDLDIEAGSLDPTVNARRAQAIAALQHAQAAAGKPLAAWLTLAVDPSGLPSSGVAAIRQMMAAGVTVSGVNVMAFDYGPLAAGQTVLSASESALSNTATQVQSLGLSWSELGATVMAGNTDTPGETWTLADAHAFYSFAFSHRLGRVSLWSLNRDQQCVGTQPQPSDSCSGVIQQPLQFSKVLGQNPGAKLIHQKSNV